MLKNAKYLIVSLILAACGGGGGSSAAPIPVTPSTLLPAVDISPIAANDPGSLLPAGWQHGAFMEIFVRSDQDSEGDGIGDLQGLISRLDDLKELGIKGIWLMPVKQSQDADHGDAVSDYRSIEAKYGGLDDFDELLKQAHGRGIGVITDHVMNHSAAQHLLFINSKDADSNTYRSGCVWQNPAPSGGSIHGGNPWRSTPHGAYFAPFSERMPDFNLLNTVVVDFQKTNLRFWLNRGVDGFRFDAVGNLVETSASAWVDQPRSYTLMGEMRSLMDGDARRHLVCEAPGDPTGYAAPTACGSAFNLQSSLMNAARGDAAAKLALANCFKTAPADVATLLSHHDSFAGARAWDQLGGNVAQSKLAAAAYLLLPGSPFIYYGEEVGMAGASTLSGDAGLRTPMSWGANTANAGFSTGTPYRALSANVAKQNAVAQVADPASILTFYGALLGLRNSLPALAQGRYAQAFASGSMLGYQRSFGSKDKALVLIKFGSAASTAAVAALPADAVLANAYPPGSSDSAANAAGLASIALPAQSVRVFSIR